MKDRFSFDGEDIKEYEDTLTMEQILKKLNDYDRFSKTKDKKINKLREIEELQREVICGVVAYFKLKERWY
ncbi:MAG: hypothetical protein IJ287_06095 [Methanobrevibacter sp.]|nr:hypothetical protein [Methanobrevibacter sp.]